MIPNMVNLATTVLHTVQWLFLVDVKVIFVALNLEGDKFTTLNCSQKKLFAKITTMHLCRERGILSVSGLNV